MGARTLNNLKNTNRTFDNILDSFTNITDGYIGQSRFGYVDNTTAFIQNDTSNATWTQPAGTVLTDIYLFVVLQPTITVNASMDLGYIVGTADGDGTYVAAHSDGLIDAAANTTALKTGAFAHIATRDIGDLGESGPFVRLLPVPDTSDDTTFVADGSYASAARDIVAGTSATDFAIAAPGTVRWFFKYIQVAAGGTHLG